MKDKKITIEDKLEVISMKYNEINKHTKGDLVRFFDAKKAIQLAREKEALKFYERNIFVS